MKPFESRGQHFSALPSRSSQVEYILIQTAMTTQLSHLPTFGPQDVLLTMLRQNNSVLRIALQKTLPRLTEPHKLQAKLEDAIRQHPRKQSERRAVRPSETMYQVLECARQYAREQEVNEYTEAHLLKAIFSTGNTQEINSACQDLGINRRGLANQL